MFYATIAHLLTALFHWFRWCIGNTQVLQQSDRGAWLQYIQRTAVIPREDTGIRCRDELVVSLFSG